MLIRGSNRISSQISVETETLSRTSFDKASPVAESIDSLGIGKNTANEKEVNFPMSRLTARSYIKVLNNVMQIFHLTSVQDV